MTPDDFAAILAARTPGRWRASDDEPSDVVLYAPIPNATAGERWLANVGAWNEGTPQHTTPDEQANADRGNEPSHIRKARAALAETPGGIE